MRTARRGAEDSPVPAWLNIDAVVPAILRDDGPELLEAADRLLDAVAAFVRR